MGVLCKTMADPSGDSFSSATSVSLPEFITNLNSATVKVTLDPKTIEITKDANTLTLSEPTDRGTADVVSGSFGTIDSKGKANDKAQIEPYATAKFAEVRRAVLTHDALKNEKNDDTYAAAVVVLTKILNLVSKKT